MGQDGKCASKRKHRYGENKKDAVRLIVEGKMSGVTNLKARGIQAAAREMDEQVHRITNRFTGKVSLSLQAMPGQLEMELSR